MSFKYGKLPAVVDHRDIMLHDVLGLKAPGLQEAPVGFGHWPKVDKLGEQWGTLGNDQYGDCVWAGAAHETMLWNAIRGVSVAFSDQSVLSDYSAVTGFNPNDPNSDRGTDPRQALLYRQKTGVLDANGNRHQIGAFVALEPGNWDQLLQALWAFDSVALGIEVPSYAQAQFAAGKAWSYIGQAPIEGGHYIPCFGRPDWNFIYVLTWGRLQRMSKKFYEHFNDQAFAVLSLESLNQEGITPEGLNIDALKAELASL